MNKLKNLFDKRAKTQAVDNKTFQQNDESVASEIRGQDARCLAEQAAEIRGAKWRADAEKSGLIPRETGGPKGLEPTRYGDWEKAGRCFDF